jgi:hypothetical protein
VRILTILTRFATEQYPRAEQELDDIFRRQMATVDRTVIVVDNAMSDDGAAGGARRLIAGDNRAREFSGFDRGVKTIGRDLERFDLVHFATSAFNSLYVRYLDRFEPGLLGRFAGRPLCLGHIDAYNDGIGILGFHSQHWIRTGFFFLPPGEVKLLGSFVSVRDGERFFSGDPARPFREDAPLSQNYRRYIIDWLTGADIGQGVQWHSHFELTPETLPRFEHKALSIMNEHLLSIRLRALGCRQIDVTWAASVLARSRGAKVRWNTPWRQQLAERDRDAVVLPAAPAPAAATSAPGIS